MIRYGGVNTMRFLKALLIPLLGLALLAPAQAPKKEDVKKAATSAATAELIDINTASIDQLKTIKGIGDAYSKKIVDGRPYRAKNELVTKKIMPQGVYDKIKD